MIFLPIAYSMNSLYTFSSDRQLKRRKFSFSLISLSTAERNFFTFSAVDMEVCLREKRAFLLFLQQVWESVYGRKEPFCFFCSRHGSLSTGEKSLFTFSAVDMEVCLREKRAFLLFLQQTWKSVYGRKEPFYSFCSRHGSLSTAERNFFTFSAVDMEICPRWGFRIERIPMQNNLPFMLET